MATWEELLERNRQYAESGNHTPRPYFSESLDPKQPPPEVFIISCIDTRVPVDELLQVKPTEAFIVRSAGARVRPNLNDLLFLDTFTKGGVLKQVIVIHHTDCGFTHNSDEGVKGALKTQYPHLTQEINQLHFGTYGSGSIERLEETIREDLDFLRSQGLVRDELKKSAKGYIYDIKTGKLALVSDLNEEKL